MQTGKHSRYQKRLDERRKIDYQLKTDSSMILNNKIKLNNDIISNYISNIEINNQASFGIKKLYQLDLDEWYLIDKYVNIDQNLINVLKNTNYTLSLMLYAVLLNKDSILASLLRSGCNPIYNCTNKQLIYDVINKLLNILPQYDIWIVKYYYSLLLSSHLYTDNNNQYCNQCNSSDYLLTYYQCKHIICNECFWKNITNNNYKYKDLCCGICNITLLPDPMNKIIYLISPLVHKIPSIKTSNQLKQESLDKYNKITISIKCDKPKIIALPYSHLCRLYTGKNRKQRQEQFYQAINNNNVLRINALIEVGINIDERNEYGQTGLYLAVMNGFDDIVRLLINSYDADVMIGDYLNYLPWYTAKCLGYNEISNYIYDHMLDKLNAVINPFIDISYIINSCYDSYNYNIIELIPSTSSHAGAGAIYIDNGIPENITNYLLNLITILPIATPEKKCSSDRIYYYDTLDIVSNHIRRLVTIQYISENYEVVVFSKMRFILYNEIGGCLPPHVDLSKSEYNNTTDKTITSTHTFILYLTTCESSGETILLNNITDGLIDDNVVQSIQPLAGRLLVFPHSCPHLGNIVNTVPKALLRGEVGIYKTL